MLIYQTIIHSFESSGKMCNSRHHLLLENNVIYGVRRCNYDRIISNALEKKNRKEKKNTSSLILVTNIHWQARASQCI